MSAKKWSIVVGLLVITSLVLSACATATPQVVEKVVTQVVKEVQTQVQTQVVEKKVVETKVVESTKVVEKVVSQEDYTTPHPILNDLKVRQAIAYCIDREKAIASVYPDVQDKKALLMDTFLPKTHWAYKGPYQPDYSYNPDKGKALLDEAGWTLAKKDDPYRTNKNGDLLAIKFTTTNAQFRQTWSAVVEQNLKDCGIQLLRNFVPSSWWFGSNTGLAHRDFELGAYAWVGEADPKGQTLYACNQIPLPSNKWAGQNYMGWCNKAASDAIIAANNTLKRDDRIKFYDTVQKEFVKDMVSIPMFQRVEAEAWSKNFDGLKADPTEYGTASAPNWSLKNNKDTLVIGFSQEPASMYDLAESAAVEREVYQLIFGTFETQFSYDYQPGLHDPLSTIENNLATNNMVDVKAGDTVFNTDNKPEKLQKGTKVLVNGAEVTWDGAAALKLPQLVVTYKLKSGLTWSDGKPVVAADMQLGYKQDCDKESGAVDYTICDGTAKADFTDGQAVVTYLPGYQYSLYFLYPYHIYPSHRQVAGGKTLKDVAAKEWSTLPEIAEKPMGFGPYMITEWTKGQSIKLTANPNYKPAPKIKNITIVIIEDTNQAKAQLLSGDVDWLEKATLGADFGDLVKAADQGKINIHVGPNPTWEHIDFNLFTK